MIKRVVDFYRLIRSLRALRTGNCLDSRTQPRIIAPQAIIDTPLPGVVTITPQV